MIYFAATSTGSIKIGYTGDVEVRLDQLEGHYGEELALLATMPGDRAKEREIHRRFAGLRFGRTEQFRPGPDLMAFIGKPLLVSADPDLVESKCPERKTMPVRLGFEAIEAGKIAASFKGMSLAEYATAILLDAANRDIDEWTKARTQGQSAKRKEGRK